VKACHYPSCVDNLILYLAKTCFIATANAKWHVYFVYVPTSNFNMCLHTTLVE